MPDNTDKKIVELSHPLINEELQEVLDNYEKARDKKMEKALADIQEVVDKTRTEVTQIGKDQIDNTKSLEDLNTRFEAFRKTIKKDKDENQEELKHIVRAETKETVHKETKNAVESAIEPHKHILRKIAEKKPKFSLKFWKRG